MKTKTFFKKTLVLTLGFAVMSLMACDKKESKPVDDDDNGTNVKMELSMEVDGKKWDATVIEYFSFFNDPEDSDTEEVYAQSIKAQNKDNEIFSLLFSIPATEIQNATGTHDIGETISEPNYSYFSGLVSYTAKNSKKYKEHYATEKIAGTVTLTKAVFGDQGTINGVNLGNGLKEIEGTFQFELYEIDSNGENKIKLKQGKFKLKTGVKS